MQAPGLLAIIRLESIYLSRTNFLLTVSDETASGRVVS